MIRVGCLLPSQSRPSRRRTLPYTKRYRRLAADGKAKRSAVAPPVLADDQAMLFDLPPAALPVATVVPKDRGTQLAADLRGWLATRWYWFKPRTIPMIVAFVGMLAVIGAATWLRNYARQAPERVVDMRSVQVGVGD
jgi:hypothetical protein